MKYLLDPQRPASRAKTPDGYYYNLERMLKALIPHDIPVGVCGTCMDARGLAEADLLPGVHKCSLDELTNWTVEADKIMAF